MATDAEFIEQANKYAASAISSIREMVEAMEHAAECDGDCEDCEGSGKQPCETCQGEGTITEDRDSTQEIERDCPDCEHGQRDCITCKGSGKCQQGIDADCPEAWHDEDEARQRIEEDALSVEVRSDWHTPGQDDGTDPTEFCILITTGGPAARIIGDLDQYHQPKNARFEYQDWFKPWTEVTTTSEQDAAILAYAQVFYFGE